MVIVRLDRDKPSLSRILSVRLARLVPVFLSFVVLAATVALRLGAGSSDAAVSAVSSTMHAVVHQDSTISLTFDDGTSVGSQARDAPVIPAGAYTIRVLDDADIHNFHLVGPGVDQATSIDGEGSPTWTVTIQPGGLYRFVCDSHADFMFGNFQDSGSGAAISASSGTSSGSSSG